MPKVRSDKKKKKKKKIPLSFQTINMVFGVFHLYLHLTHLGHIFFPSTTTTIISTRRSWKRFINYLISNPLHLPNLCMYSPKYLGSTLALHFQSNPICSIKYTRICLNALYAVLLPNCNLIPHKHAKGLYVEFLSFTYNLSYLLPPHLNMSLIVNNGLLIPSLWLLRAFAADTLNGAKFLNLEYQIKKFLCSGYSKRYSKSRIQENLGSNTLN
jgi:hypothetical protein